jgi:hypothetical protein
MKRVLAEIHSWFTEGFDTADLKDAKALLEELARPLGWMGNVLREAGRHRGSLKLVTKSGTRDLSQSGAHRRE